MEKLELPDSFFQEEPLTFIEEDVTAANEDRGFAVPGTDNDLRHRDVKPPVRDDTEHGVFDDLSKDTKRPVFLREREHTSSLPKGVYNIINTTIGAGILVLPLQMKQVGLAPGIFLLCFIGVLSTFSLHLLNRIGQKTKIDSYLGVAHAAYGKVGQFIVAVSIWLLLVSALSGYTFIIGTYLAASLKFFRSTSGVESAMDEWYVSRDFLSACVVLVVGLPLSLLPRFSKIAYASMACLIALGYVTIMMIYQFAHDVSQSGWKRPPISAGRFDILTFLPVLALIGMAYINQTSLYNVTAELKNPTPRRKTILVIVSNSAVLLFYIVFSVFGYLNYGDVMTEDILYYQPLNTAWTIARISMAFVMAFSIPLLTFPTRQCFDWMIQECYMLIQKGREMPEEAALVYWDRTAKYRFVAEAVFILALSYGIAVGFGALEKILVFFGSITGASILYTFPCLFYMRIIGGGLRNSLRSRDLMDWACNLTLFVGLIIFFVGTIFSIRGFFL